MFFLKPVLSDSFDKQYKVWVLCPPDYATKMGFKPASYLHEM